MAYAYCEGCGAARSAAASFCGRCGFRAGTTTVIVQQQQSMNSSAGQGTAIAALVLGILCVVTFPASILFGLPALLLGVASLRAGAMGGNRGMAVTGIVLGGLSILGFVLFLLWLGLMFGAMGA